VMALTTLGCADDLQRRRRRVLAIITHLEAR
jgi:hypothetical protein